MIYPIGHPQAPMSDGKLALKFDACCAEISDAASAAQLRDALFDLSHQPDLITINALLAAACDTGREPHESKDYP
jgi:hypothetical protein